MYSNYEIYANKGDNMVASVNMSEVNGNNNDHIMKNFDKISEEITQNTSTGYRQQDYLNFGQSPGAFNDNNEAGKQYTKSNNGNSEKLQDFTFVSTETNEDQTLDSKLEVKVEQLTINSPFTKDINGVMSPLAVNGRIVYSDMSIEEATLCMKNGPDTTPVYYECPYCNILMGHPKRFLIHVKWHSFGLTNTRRMEMMKELEKVRTERRKARTMERLSKNEARDQSAANFPCKDCEKIFITKTSLKRHRVREHPSMRSAGGSCRICYTAVGGPNELRIHMDKHKNKDAYQCPDCPKTYKFVHSLIKHMDTHLEKTHPCSICSKLFGSERQLGRHMKMHEKFARGATCHCAYCGKGYYDTFTLQIHERNHTQEKPFSCEICKSAFSTNSSLQRHLKVSHSSSKPFVCAYCGRCFSSGEGRDKHARRAHHDPALRTHLCKLCDAGYFKAKDLRKHMYKSHPKPRPDASLAE